MDEIIIQYTTVSKYRTKLSRWYQIIQNLSLLAHHRVKILAKTVTVL